MAFKLMKGDQPTWTFVDELPIENKHSYSCNKDGLVQWVRFVTGEMSPLKGVFRSAHPQPEEITRLEACFHRGIRVPR